MRTGITIIHLCLIILSTSKLGLCWYEHYTRKWQKNYCLPLLWELKFHIEIPVPRFTLTHQCMQKCSAHISASTPTDIHLTPKYNCCPILFLVWKQTDAFFFSWWKQMLISFPFRYVITETDHKRAKFLKKQKKCMALI